MGKSLTGENARIEVEHNPDCNLCKLNQNAVSVCLQGDGSDYANIMIIGEAPGCVSGDTLIDVAYRDKSKYPKGVPIQHLVGLSNFYVYSFDLDKKDIVLDKVRKVWKTGTKKVYRITYEWSYQKNHKRIYVRDSLKVSANHPFLVKKVSYQGGFIPYSVVYNYKSIDTGLKVGDRLQPIYRHLNGVGYYEVGGNHSKLHRESRFLLSNKIGRPLTRKEDVHHLDRNKLNDSWNNLKLLSKSDHTKLHLKEDGNPMADPAVKEKHLKITQSSEYRHNLSKIMKAKLADPKMYAKRLKEIDSYKGRISKTVKNKFKYDTQYYFNYLLGRAKVFGWSDDVIDEHFLKKFSVNELNKIRSNHKIVSIEEIGYASVYDMETERYHNFVANGIVIHNSDEDEEGKPFVGQAGNYLKRYLLSPAGLDEDEIRFTNAVRCHPLKNKTPTINYIKACRPYLEAEIKRVKPKVIVGMGNVPLASLLHFFYKSKGEEGVVDKGNTKVGGITKWRGHKIWLNEFNCWFVPTFHPSYAMRTHRGGSEYITDIIIKDLELAGLLSNSKHPTIPKLAIHYLKKEDDVERMLELMWDKGVYAFDIETGGTGNSDERWILGASFACCETEGFFVDWNTLLGTGVYEKFLKLVNSKDKLKIMHNGAYEIRIFNFHNIPFDDRHFDTMLAAHLLDENFEKKLKSLAWTETFYGGYDVTLEKYKYEHKIKIDYSKIDRKLLARYGAMDAITTFILYKKQIKALKEQKLYPLFHNIVMPVRRVMSEVEYTGLRVDVERAEKIQKASSTAITTLESKIYESVGREFNINSTKQLSDILFNKMKLKPYKKTKTGYSVDSETINYLKVKYPDISVFNYLSDRAYVRTMLSTHINQAINFVWSDSRVHTHYNLSGAVSGRTSCSKPSIHNIPRDSLIRSLYMASEGHVLVDADLKSAELAYLAAVSGEETFINAFNEGLDIHSTTYRKMHKLPDTYTPTKEERRTAKAVNFGIVYGITPIGLAKRLNCSIEEAEDFIEMYFEGLPKIAEYLEKEKRLVRTKGYVKSIFGRRRLLPLGLSDNEIDYQRAERQAMNSPIQGGAADYTYLGLIRLYKLIKKHRLGSKIVHSVHDCAIVDTWTYEVDAVKPLIKQGFETKIDILPIQMRVDIEVYKHWGEGGESRLQNIFESINITI